MLFSLLTEDMASENKEHVLLVFDFDHTLIDDNVDIAVVKLAPGGKIPESVRDLYSDDGWTEYMGAVFSLLHKNGVSQTDIHDCVKQIPLTPGMKELFEFLRQDKRYESIIISDANSILISFILTHFSLDSAISKVFTNPAKFDADGCLTVERYHTQDWCSLSTVNLCKGHILQNYLASRSSEGVVYSSVLYVGDGSNDLCPGLTLRPQDYLLARKGFSLWKKLQKAQEKNFKGKEILASVIGWDSGVEIITLLKTIVDKSQF